MIEKVTKHRRVLAKVAITGALVAVPMTALAVPAMADPIPGTTQADRDWNHDRDGDSHRHDRDGRDQWQDPGQWQNPGQWQQQAPQSGLPSWLSALIPSGLFGSS